MTLHLSPVGHCQLAVSLQWERLLSGILAELEAPPLLTFAQKASASHRAPILAQSLSSTGPSGGNPPGWVSPAFGLIIWRRTHRTSKMLTLLCVHGTPEAGITDEEMMLRGGACSQGPMTRSWQGPHTLAPSGPCGPVLAGSRGLAEGLGPPQGPGHPQPDGLDETRGLAGPVPNMLGGPRQFCRSAPPAGALCVVP